MGKMKTLYQELKENNGWKEADKSYAEEEYRKWLQEEEERLVARINPTPLTQEEEGELKELLINHEKDITESEK